MLLSAKCTPSRPSHPFGSLSSLLLTFVYSSTCFGRPQAHHQELNNCSSSLWFYRRSVVVAVLLVVFGSSGQPDQDWSHFTIRTAFIIIVVFFTTNVTFHENPSVGRGRHVPCGRTETRKLIIAIRFAIAP